MKTFRFILLLCFAGVLYWSIVTPSRTEQVAQASVGKKAPDFTLKDLSGKKVSLKDFQGKYVLVHFWATWCSPCVHEFPQINQLQKDFPDLNILAISLDESQDDIRSFQKKIPFAVTVLQDPTHETASLYGTFQLPETYLINAKGEIIEKWIGAQEWGDPQVRKKIKLN